MRATLQAISQMTSYEAGREAREAREDILWRVLRGLRVLRDHRDKAVSPYTATKILASITFCALLGSAPAAQAPGAKTKTLDIYVIDVEGGKVTLFVSPSGETVLLDTGNPGPRDQERIMTVLSSAGVKQIDHLVTTHYHVDHIGGMQELARQIPIKHYVDHGPSVEEREQIAGFQAAYAELRSKAKHTVAKAGDRLPIAGIDWRVVTSAGKAIKTALPGGGKPNPHCAAFKPRENTRDPENSQSLGSVISFGKFRAIDLGDLLWNNEFDLMCPNNPVGTVDVYLVSHHGIDPSGSEALVHALQPRVAIMQNGTRKGGTVQTSQIINGSPNLEDLWQLHWSYNGGVEHNPAGLFIANVDEPAVIANVLTMPPAARGAGPAGPPPAGVTPAAPPAGASAPPAAVPPTAAPAAAAAPASSQPPMAGPPAAAAPGSPAPGARQGGPGGGRGGAQAHAGPAFWIKVSARADGSFTVTNTRNGFSRTYNAR
jgi:competence protein ComEC